MIRYVAIFGLSLLCMSCIISDTSSTMNNNSNNLLNQLSTTQARYSDENGLELTLNGYRDITSEVFATLESHDGILAALMYHDGMYSDMRFSHYIDTLHKVYLREAGDRTLVVQIFLINLVTDSDYDQLRVNGTVCGQNAFFHMNMNHRIRKKVVEFILNDTWYVMGFLPYDDDSTEFTEDEIIAILETCPEH